MSNAKGISRISLGGARLELHPRTLRVGAALVLLLLVGTLAQLASGTIRIPLPDILLTLLGESSSNRNNLVVWELRAPRAVTGIAVGLALGAAGSVFQSVSRNALGSPDIIGFTRGAAAGAVVQIVFFNAGPVATAVSAVLAGLLTALVVYVLARRGRTTGGSRLILVGIGVGAFLAAMNTLLLARADIDLATKARVWLSGSLNARTWDDAAPVVIAVVLLLPLLAYYSRNLDILEMGDDQALQLGINPEKVRRVVLVAGTVLTAASVSAAGPIAFVALAAPHITSDLVRHARVHVVTSALMGAVLLVGADLLAIYISVRLATPVGLVTGTLGGAYLLWILTRSRNV
ncbi:FecCD family ABC transporter permease [Dermabacteraceae bacterium P7074]